MKSLLPSPTFRYLTILVLIIICTVALIKSATSSAQEGRSNVESTKAQEASKQEQKTDVLERLISSDPGTKSPDDSGTIIPSQVEEGANLLTPTIGATKVDTLFTDVDGDGRADPGDTLLYTVTITNSGTVASNVVFSDTIDTNTTLVGGTVNSSPIGFDDPGYTAAGNVRITISSGSGVLVNDIDPDTGSNTGLTASAGATSAQGGNVAMSANGGFSYNPAPGFTGTDTFTYTVSDGVATGTGTVTFNVSGMIWFVNAAAGGGGDGRLTTPFNCYTGVGCYSAVAADDPGDNIFLYTGSYSGGNTLLANQRLIGQGAGASLSTITGITPPTGSDALPPTVGTRPTITTVLSPVNAINLGSGNTLRGFNIGNTTAADIAGTSFGTLTASEMDLNGTGSPLILTTGTLAATFDTLTATSAAGGPGIGLSGVGGTLTVTGTTSISGAGTQGISISGSSVAANFGTSTTIGSTTQGILVGTSTGNVSFGNTIVTAGSDGVSLQNNSAGTRSFGTLSTTNGSGVGFLHSTGGGATTVSGQATFTNPGGRCMDIQDSTTALTFNNVNATQCGGTGVFFDDNTGAITFADLDISPDNAQKAFQSTDQTTGAITTTSGAIITTNASSVEITGTSAVSKTPLNMQLTSVATTGGANATNGIFLKWTSSSGSPGGFRVLGTGGTCTQGTPTCTGGTITNTTGADNTTNGIGVYLEDVASIVLTRMHINIHPNFAVRGKLVNTWTLDTCVIDGDNGTSATADDDGFDSGEDAVRIAELTGTAAITNSFIAGGFEDTIRITNSSGTLNRLTVSGSTIGGRTNNGTSMDDAFSFTARTTATMNLSVLNSTFTTGRGDIFNPRVLNASNMDLVFRGNTVSNNHPAVVTGGGGTTIASTTSATFTYDVSCNKFTGGAGLKTHQLLIFKGSGAAGTLSGTVFNNKVGTTGVPNSGSPAGSNGILVDSQGTGTHTVLIKNNVVRNYGQVGMAVLAASGSVTVNATIIGNLTAEPDPVNGFAGLQVQSGAIAADSTTINARVGSLGTASEKNNFVAGDPGNFNDVEISQAGAPGGVKVVNLSRAGSVSGTVSGVINDDNITPLTVVNFGVVNLVAGNPATPPAIDETCTPPARQAGIEKFELSSICIDSDTAPALALHNISDRVFASLMSNVSVESAVSNASDNVNTSVVIPQWQPSLLAGLNNRSDNHSASSTLPRDSRTSEPVSLNHARGQEERRGAPDASAEVKDHTPQEDKRQDGSVKPTTNEASDAKGDKDEVVQSGETVTVNGGSPAGFTLPAGKATTITFRVTVNSGVLPAFTQVSNQGSVSGSNFFAVIMTDDPSIGGSADPTVTPIDHTTVAIASSGTPSVFGQNVTFTATMTGVPARASDPPGTVQFKADGNNIGAAVPIVGGAPNDNVSTAQASISSLSVGSHVITAEYSGGGSGATGYNANIGTLAVNQVVNKSNTASAIITDTPDPSLTGQNVTVTFTVTPTGGGAGTPTGDVTVSDGVDQCTATAAVGNCTLALSTAGARTLTATYVGDGNFNASPASPGAAHTVSNTAVWDGSTSGDWEDNTNWTTNLKPAPIHSVNIPAGVLPNEPAISTVSPTVIDLTVATGRTLTVDSGPILTATGNTVMSGNLAGGGTSNFNNLTINNALGVSIGFNASVSGVLTLTSGNTTVAGTLSVGGAGSITRTAGHIIGNLKKTFSAPGSFTYHVGTANGYSPLVTTVTAGSGDLTVKANQGTAPSVPALNSATTLQRYWTLTEAGSLTANLTFNYLDLDIMGIEANYRIIRVEGGVPVSLPNNCPSPCVNPATNTAVINGVTNFSEWTLGEPFAPTAISADLGGRVTYTNGRPMRGITVSLLNVNTSEVILTRTNAKGLYKFSQVVTGADYLITPYREGYEFNPPNRVINHTGLRENVDFGTTLSTKPVPNKDDPTQKGEVKQGSNPIPADFVPPAEP